MTDQPDGEQQHEDADTIWVRTWRLPGDRGYGVRMNLGATAWGLDRGTAIAYAVAVIGAATEAEHDVATFRSFVATGMTEELAATFLARDIRPARTGRFDAGQPLELRPGVARDDDGSTRPFLGIYLNGEQAGQLDPDEAREHAVQVLGVLAAADLDSGLRRALVGPVGLDEARASAVIHALGEHWPGSRP